MQATIKTIKELKGLYQELEAKIENLKSENNVRDKEEKLIKLSVKKRTIFNIFIKMIDLEKSFNTLDHKFKKLGEKIEKELEFENDILETKAEREAIYKALHIISKNLSKK